MLAGAQRLSNRIISQARETAEQLMEAARKKEACALKLTQPTGAIGSHAKLKGASVSRRGKRLEFSPLAECIDASCLRSPTASCNASYDASSYDASWSMSHSPADGQPERKVSYKSTHTAARAKSSAATAPAATTSASSPLAAYHMRRMHHIINARQQTCMLD
jgi:hypothetical protein